MSVAPDMAEQPQNAAVADEPTQPSSGGEEPPAKRARSGSPLREPSSSDGSDLGDEEEDDDGEYDSDASSSSDSILRFLESIPLVNAKSVMDSLVPVSDDDIGERDDDDDASVDQAEPAPSRPEPGSSDANLLLGDGEETRHGAEEEPVPDEVSN